MVILLISRAWRSPWMRRRSAKRFTVLVGSRAYRGCAIPVAWKVVGAEQKGGWKPHWLKLLEKLAGSVPETERIVTLWDDGNFETDKHRAFLRSLGYQEAEPSVYGKQL
jgi:hypothetical protein